MDGYVLENGYVLTNDEIERRVEEFEKEEWEAPGIVVKAGRPKLSEEPLKNLSFKCPEMLSDLIDAACKATGMKKSAFLRQAALVAASNALVHTKS